MNDIDFSACRFIKENMQFYTYYDFCDNCYSIKKLFVEQNSDARLFYEWYIYANIHMSEVFKNAIWDFLNSEEPATYIRLIELKKQYRAK